MAVFLHMFHVIALAADVNVISARLYHLSKQSDEPEMWYIWGPHQRNTPFNSSYNYHEPSISASDSIFRCSRVSCLEVNRHGTPIIIID